MNTTGIFTMLTRLIKQVAKKTIEMHEANVARIQWLEEKIAEIMTRTPKDYSTDIHTIKRTMIGTNERLNEIEKATLALKESQQTFESNFTRHLQGEMTDKTAEGCEDTAVLDLDTDTIVIEDQSKPKEEQITEEAMKKTDEELKGVIKELDKHIEKSKTAEKKPESKTKE